VPQQRGVVQAGEKYYQLTHDYLVPSLREWLTRKQKETRRGRAELLLTDRASVWVARPENRQLPSLWQWLQIRWLTQKKSWTAPQRQMMHKANRYHAVRGLLVAVLVALLGWGSYEGYHWTQAEKLVEAIVAADTTDVPRLVERLTPYRRWANPRLVRYTQEAPERSKERLHASLALVPVDGGQVEYLYRRLLEAGLTELAVIREALRDYAPALSERLWGVLDDSQKDSEQRFRAACALAGFDVALDQPHQERWQQASPFVTGQLLLAVQHNPSHYLPLLEMLRPVRKTLLGPLAEVFRRRQRPDSERLFAANILADYAALEPKLLADLLLDADEKQFVVIYPKFKEQGERGLPVLIGAIDRELPPDAKDEAKENLAKRQANAAVALLRMDQAGKVWPLLKQRSDPRVRSYLIHRFGPLGAEAQALVTRLVEEPDVTIRRALILSLGPEEFGAAAWTPEAKQRLVRELQELYCTAADPGLHAATEWLLRQWQQGDWLRQTNAAWAQDQEQREKRLDGIQRELRKQKDQTPPQWYVNSQGETMVIVPGPVEFVMGSPSTEEGRDSDEPQHKKRIGRTFAIAAKAVTAEQYRKFKPGYSLGEMEQKAPTADSPVISTDWFQAIEYCNWLSQQEGLPQSEWCYEPHLDPTALPALAASSVGLLAGSFGPLAATGGLFPEYKWGMKLARNYLQRRGYRLPTEAEWEYACRAGAVTSRYYGETEELLEKYAWYNKNARDRTWPVGSKKPNDLGLFDMHGNVWTWCLEKYQDYPQSRGDKAFEDYEDILSIKITDARLLRGGSFHAQAVILRSAFRHRGGLPECVQDIGFRLARTFR
jgi:formylglycine-generating enzyme required for sulfatase activity